MDEISCCGNCIHNKECENYQRLKHFDWLCSLYQSGGNSYEQLSLLGEDYGTK